MKFKSAFPYITAFVLVPLCIAVGVLPSAARHICLFRYASLCSRACRFSWLLKKERQCSARRDTRRDDGSLRARQICFRGDTAFQARFGYCDNHGDVSRSAVRLSLRSALGCPLKYSFRAGSVDAFSDARMGSYRAFCRPARRYSQKNKIALAVFGALAGVFYSLIMDIWTVLWWEEFSLSRYLAAIASSGVVMLIYAASNVIFLLLLAKPTGGKLGRVMKKYGLDRQSAN